MTLTSFVITLYGKCCRRHVVGQWVISDVRDFVSFVLVVEVFVTCVLNITSLPKVTWEKGRVAAKVSPHWLQWRAPNSPQKYPFPWTNPQTPLHASFLDPSDLWCQTASGSDPPFSNNALDRPTHRPTDRPRESSMTIPLRLHITRATLPNNINMLLRLLADVFGTSILLQASKQNMSYHMPVCRLLGDHWHIIQWRHCTLSIVPQLSCPDSWAGQDLDVGPETLYVRWVRHIQKWKYTANHQIYCM